MDTIDHIELLSQHKEIILKGRDSGCPDAIQIVNLYEMWRRSPNDKTAKTLFECSLESWVEENILKE